MKNRLKFPARAYDVYTLALQPPQPVKKMRALFYADNPTIDICLCYRKNGGKELVHSIQGSERAIDNAKEVLRLKKIAFTLLDNEVQ